MKLLDLTLPNPEENLALDEALLDVCDLGGPESLRFWESPVPFVVVGYGNRIASEVNESACSAANVPVLRRCSGGGTVVQGPGCWNYNLVLQIPEEGELATVTGTNRFIMGRIRAALEPLVDSPVVVEGHTDLGIVTHDCSVLKFSGNAQRRRRRALVFHGTLLLGFDLDQIEGWLNHPSAEPEYRARRSHREFITNLSLDSREVRSAIATNWNAVDPFGPLPELSELVEKYRSDAWNRRV